MKIFGDLYEIENLDKFKLLTKKLIQEIFFLSLFDSDEFKQKFSDKSISMLESTQQIISSYQTFKDDEILNFLLSLFNYCEKLNNSDLKKERSEFVRITIFKNLFDSDLSLGKYKYIVLNTLNTRQFRCKLWLPPNSILNKEIFVCII